MNDGLCTECPNRPLCKSLCAEAEIYANQDNPNYHKEGSFHLTPMEKGVLDGLAAGKTREEIAQILGITRKQLRDHIYNLKRKHRDIIL
jgi:DNA-binding NarL/FixJ family response regulator